VKILNVIIT